jgi:glucose/arabinose dehydrogenase
MGRRRRYAVAATAAALVGALVAASAAEEAAGATAGSGAGPLPAAVAAKAALTSGFSDSTAIGGVSEPVSAAFAPDGTAFVALKTGEIKSFDYDPSTGQFEGAATSTEFADLSVEVDNYGDRGLTGIAVDPRFPARPYVYVNYTLNADPQHPSLVPAWGAPEDAYDSCGPDDADEASLIPARRGCPVLDRVSRLTATGTAAGWTMAAGGEKVLVQDGCAQFSSHSSGDVAFGPDGELYASAGDGASFRGADSGQANDAGYASGAACPGDPAGQGGSLRAQDQRTSGDALGIAGTIFRMDPDAGLEPATADPAQWLVAMGQRNPWRFVFRQDKEQLWSVDVGSSNWEEINRLADAPTTSLVNRGWPCYEGANGQSVVNPSWTPPADEICPGLYAEGSGAVQPPVFSYRTRTGAGPITPGENCPSDHSSALSGIAFTPMGTSWPAAYQDALFFSDYLRGCIWVLQKDHDGQPDPGRVTVFAQAVGAPVKLLVGPGHDLYYVDYGSFGADGYDAGSGGVHRISYTRGPRSPSVSLALRSSPGKVKVKVDGKRHRTPFRASYTVGTLVDLVAPRRFAKKGVRFAFARWKGVDGKARKKRRLTVAIGSAPVSVRAVYRRVRAAGQA